MHFGQWVKVYRESRKWTQTECAARSTMSVQQWSNMEAAGIANPSISALKKVAGGFEMSLSDLITASGLSDSPRKHSLTLLEHVERQADKVDASVRDQFISTAMGAITGIASSFAAAA